LTELGKKRNANENPTNKPVLINKKNRGKTFFQKTEKKF